MWSLRMILGMSLILLACCAMPAGAANSTDIQTAVEVTTPENPDQTSRAPPVYGSVGQGEVDYHTYYVSSGHTTLEVSLTWDRSTNNDLTLTLYPPHGRSYAWDDSADGKLNGKISVKTPIPSDMTGAYWGIDITGRTVTGTQAYTLTMNSY